MENESSGGQRFNRNHSNRGRNNRGNHKFRRGGHKTYQKIENKIEYFKNKSYNNSYHVVGSMNTNLPATIDLLNKDLVTYVGEILYKDTFLEDPWSKIEQ